MWTAACSTRSFGVMPRRTGIDRTRRGFGWILLEPVRKAHWGIAEGMAAPDGENSRRGAEAQRGRGEGGGQVGKADSPFRTDSSSAQKCTRTKEAVHVRVHDAAASTCTGTCTGTGTVRRYGYGYGLGVADQSDHCRNRNRDRDRCLPGMAPGPHGPLKLRCRVVPTLDSGTRFLMSESHSIPRPILLRH